MSKQIMSLIVPLLLAASAGAAPTKLKTQALDGKEYVKALAAVCTDDEWAKVVPLIKATKLADGEVAGRELTIDGATISDGDVSVTFDQDKLKATMGGKTYEGTVCGVLAQYATVPQKTSAWSLLVRDARAEETFLPTTTSEALMAKVRSNPLHAPLLLTAAGVAEVIGLVPPRFCTTCSSFPSRIVDENELARNRTQLSRLAVAAMGANNFTVVSCSENSFTISGGGTRLIVDRKAHDMTVSNGRVTGHLESAPGFGFNYEMGFENCRNAAQAAEKNRRHRQFRTNLESISLNRAAWIFTKMARPPSLPGNGTR